MLQHRKRFSVTTVDSQDTLLGNAKQLAGHIHPHLDDQQREIRTSPNSFDIRMYDNSQTHLYNLMLAISINWKPVQAVVDTAAQITVGIVFAYALTPPLIRGEKVTMKGAGVSDYIEVNYCKETQISIGDMEQNAVKLTFLIADISYPVILGLDFLKA